MRVPIIIVLVCCALYVLMNLYLKPGIKGILLQNKNFETKTNSTNSTYVTVSKTGASTISTNATVSKTDASTISTNATVSETGVSTISTNAIVSKTGASTISTNATVNKTGASTISTNATDSKTDASTIYTNATVSKTGASTISTNATVSETGASTTSTNSTVRKTGASTISTNATISKNGESNYDKERDIRTNTNTQEMITTLPENCKKINYYAATNITCYLQEIMDYFLKRILALNNDLTKLNLFSNATGNVTQFHGDKITKIGILIPTTTRKVKCQDLLQYTLFEKSIPSILKTFTVGFVYKILIGFDRSDMYFSKLKNFTKDHAFLNSISLVEVECQTFVAAVNAVAKEAYLEGMDYLVRINDDTVFETANWSFFAIDVLKKYDPPYVGVVGPTCLQGNVGILTHDMVHRSHLDIFPYYYPPVFENWWADDWITRVYQPDRFTKLETWSVLHATQETRYVVDYSIGSRLGKAIKEGKIKLHAYAPVFKKEQNKTVTPLAM